MRMLEKNIVHSLKKAALTAFFTLSIIGLSLTFVFIPKTAVAQCTCCCSPSCDTEVGSLCSQGQCECQSNKETPITKKHITDEFIQHREWLIKIVWEAHLLPAMLLMSEQISTLALHQVFVIGTFFDAKHQLESQRLLQELQSDAHKAYHPSTGMCEFGTNTRSIAASERKAEITQIALATRSTQRQLLSGDLLSVQDSGSDLRSRLDQLQQKYCNPNDMGRGFTDFCQGKDTNRYNNDIDYTAKIDSQKTLKLDFTNTDTTEDEEDLFALSANLYGHYIMPRIPEDRMANKDGSLDGKEAGAISYMKLRSHAAKRSVAQAAFAAQAAMRTQGEDSSKPYMEAILKEMGLEQRDIDAMIQEKPSYHMQMELLTKKLYQNPVFYTNLYDKPANIDRMNTSMLAIALMQRRDMVRSNLRSEAIAAVWLETRLKAIEDVYSNEAARAAQKSELLNIE